MSAQSRSPSNPILHPLPKRFWPATRHAARQVFGGLLVGFLWLARGGADWLLRPRPRRSIDLSDHLRRDIGLPPGGRRAAYWRDLR